MDVQPSLPDDGGARYRAAVEDEDRQLDRMLASIRSRADAGTISIRQAADERVEALVQHLAAVRQLLEAHRDGGE
jgi:hypothetical protein